MWDLKEAISSFLVVIDKVNFPEFSNREWFCDFAFAVDMLTQMNELNINLKWKDQNVYKCESLINQTNFIFKMNV